MFRGDGTSECVQHSGKTWVLSHSWGDNRHEHLRVVSEVVGDRLFYTIYNV